MAADTNDRIASVFFNSSAASLDNGSKAARIPSCTEPYALDRFFCASAAALALDAIPAAFCV